MEFQKRVISGRAARANRQVERVVNRFVRRYDDLLRAARVGGRKADYDDEQYTFEGGAGRRMRRLHYDKGLRLLWKSETHTPWLGFHDGSPLERRLSAAAEKAMNPDEREMSRELSLPEFKAMLNREYSPREKQAVVSILSAIGHGEAYAWLVATELLAEAKSTGAKAALTLQVLEEAKHFVVLRELLRAFDVPIPRLSAWEYLLLESVYKLEGTEKFFGMHMVVEGIALGLFGMMSGFPGLGVLRQFHLDEARHAALPSNYLREFPLSRWQKHNPFARMRRLRIILPAFGLIPLMEEDMAELGLDAFEYGGSVVRKTVMLAERNGFLLPVPASVLLETLDTLFNAYCRTTRPGHARKSFIHAETTQGEEQLAVEREVYQAAV